MKKVSNFTVRFKELRNERGLSQREIAEMLGVSHISIARYELGGETTFDMLVKIAKFFGVTTDYLLGVEDI